MIIITLDRHHTFQKSQSPNFSSISKHLKAHKLQQLRRVSLSPFFHQISRLSDFIVTPIPLIGIIVRDLVTFPGSSSQLKTDTPRPSEGLLSSLKSRHYYFLSREDNWKSLGCCIICKQCVETGVLDSFAYLC